MSDLFLDKTPDIPAAILEGMVGQPGAFLIWRDANQEIHMGDFACPQKPKGTAALGDLCGSCEVLAGCQLDRPELKAPLMVVDAFTSGLKHPVILDRVELSGGFVADNTDPVW